MSTVLTVVVSVFIVALIISVLRTQEAGGWDFPEKKPTQVNCWWRPENWKEGQEFYQWAFVAPGIHRRLRPRLYRSPSQATEAAARATIHNSTLRTAVVHRVVYTNAHLWVKERVACVHRGRVIEHKAASRHLAKIGVDYTPSFTLPAQAAQAHGYKYPRRKPIYWEVE